MESETRVKTPHSPVYQPASERERGERADREKGGAARQKELPRVWSSEGNDLLATSTPPEYDSRARITDRSNPNTTRRRKPQKSVDVMAGPETEGLTNEFSPGNDEAFIAATPKTYQSNSFNTGEGEGGEGDDPEYRQGSIKNTSRVLNAAKYVFTRDSKSRSSNQNQKSSRSANTKLSAGPAIASIKKMLQNPIPRPPVSSNNNSFTKSFEEAPSVKTLSFSGTGEPRSLLAEQHSAFKKQSKEILFSRLGKSGGGFGGTPPEERGNGPRSDN